MFTHKNMHMPYRVDIVDCVHVRSATASLKGLVTVALENSTNQTADILIADQLQAPLDLVIVFFQQQEIHKPNSRTERE